VRSPTPQERAERTLYSWVANPHEYVSRNASGRPSHSGVTTSGQSASVSPLRACSTW